MLICGPFEKALDDHPAGGGLTLCERVSPLKLHRGVVSQQQYAARAAAVDRLDDQRIALCRGVGAQIRGVGRLGPRGSRHTAFGQAALQG